MTLQENALSLIKQNCKLKDKLYYNEKEIENIAIALLSELRKIKGWENLIEDCRWHYELYPNQFFNWCNVDFSQNTVNFVKEYNNGCVFDVLRIKLDISLEEQVKKAVNKEEERIAKEENDVRERELATLKRLKEKYENI